MARSARILIAAVTVLLCVGSAVAPALAAPPNDAIAAAQALNLDQRVNVDTAGATNEPGEPPHTTTESGTASVWFKWTNGPAARTTVVDLEGSDYDTVLAVYNSAAPSSNSRVRSIDLPVPFASEYLDFAAAPNATYWIAVDSFLLGVTGKASIRITQSPPVDDALGAARDLALVQDGSLLQTYAGFDSALATTEPGEPELAGATPFRTQWFQLVAPRSGRLVASTCGSLPDTVVGVYSGSTFGTLREVGSGDISEPGGCGDDGAYVGFPAAQGTTYRIATGVFLSDPAPSGGVGILRLHYDDQAPTARIGGGPSAFSRDPTATFELTADGSDVAGFDCSLDDAEPKTCVAKPTFSGLSESPHKLRVRARDAAGNVGPPAERGWIVDRTPPETRIIGAPGKTVLVADAQIGFDAEPGASYFCSLDGGAPAPCSSPARFLRLANGRHSFTVRARDGAGNEDPTPASVEWTVRKPVGARVRPTWQLLSRGVRVFALRVENVRKGMQVEVRCRGRGCPFARRTRKVRRSGRITLNGLFGQRVLRPGAVVEVRVSASGASAVAPRFTVRGGRRAPKETLRCLPPGAKRTVACPRARAG